MAAATPSPHLLVLLASVALCASTTLLGTVNQQLLTLYLFQHHVTLSVLATAAISSLSLYTLRRLGGVDAVPSTPMTWNIFSTTVAPIILCSVLAQSLTHAMQGQVSPATAHIGAALAPIPQLALLCLCGMEAPTLRLMGALLLVAAGGLMAISGAVGGTAGGVALLVGAQAAGTLRLVLTQRLLTTLNFGTLEGLTWTSTGAALCLLCGAVLRETPADVAISLDRVASAPGLLLLASGLGFCASLCAFFVVRHGGGLAVQLLVSGQATFAVAGVSALQAAGDACMLGGLGWFFWSKAEGGAKPPKVVGFVDAASGQGTPDMMRFANMIASKSQNSLYPGLYYTNILKPGSTRSGKG